MIAVLVLIVLVLRLVHPVERMFFRVNLARAG